ncbi:MAG: hypothetical protein D6753_16960 [Planctomycetota bacterium]|nr:MAG: hypothetical protein D6753_16960 [Planctomycetota bacterium]
MIQFNHVSHRDKHFSQKGAEFDCSMCHIDHGREGIVGTVYRSVGFDRACGDCHAESISASLAEGWDVLAIPSLDASMVGAAQDAIPPWPAAAKFGIEGRIPILLRVLLAADDAVRSDLAELPVSGKLEEVPQVVRRRVAAAIARGVIACVEELHKEGQHAWQTRLARVLELAQGDNLNQRQREIVARASRGIPPDLFSIVQQWFVPAHAPSRAAGRQSVVPASGAVQEGLFDFDLSEESPPPPGRAGRREAENDFFRAVAPPARRAAYGGWLVDADTLSLKYRGLGHADPAITAWADYLRELDSLLSAERSSGTQLAFLAAAVGQPARKPLELLPGNCSQCHLNQPPRTYDAGLSMFSSAGSGRTLVHTDGHGDDRTNWMAVQRPDTARLFTRFDHTPHTALPELADCAYCHRMDDPPVPDGNHVGNSQRAIEFAPMQREQCVACHSDGDVSRCTTCHLYHVGDSGLKWGHHGGSVSSIGVTSSGEGRGGPESSAGAP